LIWLEKMNISDPEYLAIIKMFGLKTLEKCTKLNLHFISLMLKNSFNYRDIWNYYFNDEIIFKLQDEQEFRILLETHLEFQKKSIIFSFSFIKQIFNYLNNQKPLLDILIENAGQEDNEYYESIFSIFMKNNSKLNNSDLFQKLFSDQSTTYLYLLEKFPYLNSLVKKIFSKPRSDILDLVKMINDHEINIYAADYFQRKEYSAATIQYMLQRCAQHYGLGFSWKRYSGKAIEHLYQNIDKPVTEDKVAVYIINKFDQNSAFQYNSPLKFNSFIKRGYRLLIFEAGNREEAQKIVINNNYFNGKVDVLYIGAHGFFKSINLGKEAISKENINEYFKNYGKIFDRNEETPPTTLLDSCAVGNDTQKGFNFVEEIHSILNTRIFASKRITRGFSNYFDFNQDNSIDYYYFPGFDFKKVCSQFIYKCSYQISNSYLSFEEQKENTFILMPSK
jgi:uncharacterized protein DUF4347